MHTILMLTVLVSGLAAGDGGGRGGEDHGRTCVDLAGDWEGTAQEGGERPFPVRLSGGIFEEGQGNGQFEPLWGYELVPQGGNRVEVVMLDKSFPGIYRPEGRGVCICFSSDPNKRPTLFVPKKDEVLLVLHRPKPKK